MLYYVFVCFPFRLCYFSSLFLPPCATSRLSSRVFYDAATYGEKSAWFSGRERRWRMLCSAWWLRRDKANGKIHATFLATRFSRTSSAMRVGCHRWHISGWKAGKIADEKSSIQAPLCSCNFPAVCDFDFPTGHDQSPATPQKPEWNDCKLFT